MAAPKLQIVVGADITKAEKNLKKLSARIKNLGKDFSNFGFSMTKMTAPLTAWGGSAVAASLKIQECLKTIRAGTGATGEALKGLTADFKAVGAKSSAPLNSVAVAVADLNTRLGLSGAPLQEMALNVAEAARMTGEDTKTLANEASKAMNNAGIAANQGAGFMDKLFLASQSTGIGMSELANKLYKFGTPMREMGFSLEETVALMGSFDRAGVSIDKVMNAFNFSLAKLSKTGEEDVPGALTKTIKSIQDAGSMAAARSIALEAFGQKAGPYMAAAIRSGRFAVEDLVKTLMKSKGAIQENAVATDLFTEKWAKVKNQITISLQPLGDAIIALSDKYILPLAESMSKLTPEFSQWVVVLGACVVAIGPVTWAFGSFMTVLTGGTGVILKAIFGVQRLYAAMAASGALTVLIRDMGAAGVAMSATGAAAKTTAASMVVASSGVGKLRLAMTGLGTALTGPLGIVAAIASVAAAWSYVYFQSAERAREKTQRVADAVEALKTEIEGFSADQLSTALQKQMSTIDALNAKLAETESRLRNFNGSAGTSVMAVGGIGQLAGQQNQLQDAIALEKAKAAALEKALKEAQSINAVKSGQVAAASGTGNGVKDSIKLRISSMRDSIKYEGAHPAAYLEELRKMLAAQPKELTDDKKLILDAISDFSGQKRSGGSGVSAVASRISSMQDEINYLGSDPSSYLTELEAMYAKMPEALSEDKKAIMDMQESIVEAVSDQQDAAAAKLKAQKEKLFNDLSFQNSMGMLSNGDYATALQKDFESMKALLADTSVSSWTDDMKERFRELQQVMGNVAGSSLESLKKQFENNKIASAEYESALAAIIAKYHEYPLVVKEAQEALAAFHEAQASKLPTVLSQVNQSFDDMKMKLAELPSSIGDAFTQAIAKGESLSDCLTSLLQDIGAVIVKALVMKSIFGSGGGLLGGLFGGGLSSTVSSASSGISAAASYIGSAKGNIFDRSGLIPFAKGGVVTRPTLFPFAKGTGLMGEAGAEGILPLSRMSNGKLGVNAEGSGSGNTEVHMTVNAVDAQSFVQMLRTNRTTIESLVVENISRNSTVRRAIMAGV